MSDDKIKRFPIKSWERERNRRGKGSASCFVTGRWLRFSKQKEKQEFGTPVWVDVMTDTGEEERKICRLCLTVEELEKALKFVSSA
jgi:hypothetical protein